MAERALIEKTDEETPLDEPNTDLRFPKDSKWAWIVCICSFLTQVLILGILHAFGVFFVEFVEDFKTSKGSAAWVGSVAYGLSMAVGPFVSMMVFRFGNRCVMMLGGTVCALSILASSFVTSISLLFLTFSVFFGIGTGLCITPTMTIGQEYFDKYASISLGIMTAGSSVGTLITAPLAQTLVRAFGWRNTFRFFSGTCALTVICNILIRPISVRKRTPTQRLRSSPARRLMEELNLWKNRVFVVWTAAITCVMFGYYIPYVHLVSYAVDNGITEEQGSMLVMILGAVTATGRVLFGKVVQYGFLNRLHMHQLSMVITGAGTMLLPLITSFGGLAVYVIIVGLVDGCYVVLLPLLTCSLVGSEQAVLAWGFLIGTCSITFTLGPPVAGFIYDAYGSYNVAFHVAGLPILTGALILFLIPWAQRTSRSSSIIKVISVVQMHDEEDASNVDFITLSKCSSVMDHDDDQSDTNVANSVTDTDLNGLYFSNINQDTVVPRSPDGRRALREVDFALSALQKSDQVLSKMLGAGKKGSSKKREIPNQTETRRSPSASSGKGSVRKSNVINISSASASPRHAASHSQSGARDRKQANVGVQADVVSVDSRAATPSQSGLGSDLSLHCFHPTASALYQAILVLEQQQQQQQLQMSYQSGIDSESSRASMSSGNNPTTPLLEEFVSGQIERLIDSLRSPNRQQFENFRSQHSSGMQNPLGEAQEHITSGPSVSGPSSRTSKGSYQSRLPSIQTKSASTQTDTVRTTEDEQNENLSQSRDELPASEQSMTSSTANLQDGLRIGTGSTPVDIPSTPILVEDSEVFSMDPLSPFGSPPSDISRIPPPPPPPTSQQEIKHTAEVASSESPNHITICDNGAVFPMDQSPQGITRNTITETLPSPQLAGTSVPKETPSSKTLIVSDGIFKMDEDHFGYAPKLQSCTETQDDVVDESPSKTSTKATAPSPVPMQTGRFTVDTVYLSDDDSVNIPTIPPPPSSVNRQGERRHRTSEEDSLLIGLSDDQQIGAVGISPCDLSKHSNKSAESDEFECDLLAACGDSSSVETTVHHEDVMFHLDTLNDVTSAAPDQTASGDSVELVQRGADGFSIQDPNA